MLSCHYCLSPRFCYWCSDVLCVDDAGGSELNLFCPRIQQYFRVQACHDSGRCYSGIGLALLYVFTRDSVVFFISSNK